MFFFFSWKIGLISYFYIIYVYKVKVVGLFVCCDLLFELCMRMCLFFGLLKFFECLFVVFISNEEIVCKVY